MLKIALAGITVAIAGCSPTHRAVQVGGASAQVGAPAPAVAIPAAGDYEISLEISMPAAVEVQWAIACPGASRRGVAGETYDAYRQRRLAELEAQRKSKAQAVGAIAGAIVGQTEVQAAAPGGGSVTASADASQAGEAVADNALPERQLSPGDTGGRVIRKNLRIRATSPGRCTMSMWSDRKQQNLSGVLGSYSISQLINLRKEVRERKQQANEIALKTRADIVTNLVELGADPAHAERQRRAEQRAKAERAQAKAAIEAEAELDVQLKAEARATVKRRRRALAYRTRSAVSYWLGECGADPGKRARDRQARLEAERRQNEADLAAFETQRVRTERGHSAALATRTRAIQWLYSRGAVDQLDMRVYPETDVPAVKVEPHAPAVVEAETEAPAVVGAETATPTVVEAQPTTTVQPPIGPIVDVVVDIPRVIRVKRPKRRGKRRKPRRRRRY